MSYATLQQVLSVNRFVKTTNMVMCTATSTEYEMSDRVQALETALNCWPGDVYQQQKLIDQAPDVYAELLKTTSK